MTDSAYHAKLWLLRLSDLSKKVEAERRTLEMLEAKLYRGVSSYDGIHYRIDPTQAQANHEENLLSFSFQLQRVEKAQNKYLHELEITQNVMEELPDMLAALLTDRYINGIKWQKLLDVYHYEKTQLFEYNQKALEQLAEVLKQRNIHIVTEELVTA